jgi:hypothetical protein
VFINLFYNRYYCGGQKVNEKAVGSGMVACGYNVASWFQSEWLTARNNFEDPGFSERILINSV